MTKLLMLMNLVGECAETKQVNLSVFMKPEVTVAALTSLTVATCVECLPLVGLINYTS